MMRSSICLAALAFGPAAGAEELWGDADHLERGQVAVLPGAWVQPSNGYGGGVLPQLYVGAGVAEGWDLRAGLSVEVPYYYRDDGEIFWGTGYGGPWFGAADLTARRIVREDFSWGVRLYSEPHDSWGLGPEATWQWLAGAFRLTLRPAYTYPLAYLGMPVFGTLWLTGAAAWVPSERVEVFAEADLWLFMEIGHTKSSGGEFMVSGEPAWRAGAWFVLGERHRVGLAASYLPESHLHPEQNVACGLRYRWLVPGG